MHQILFYLQIFSNILRARAVTELICLYLNFDYFTQIRLQNLKFRIVLRSLFSVMMIINITENHVYILQW